MGISQLKNVISEKYSESIVKEWMKVSVIFPSYLSPLGWTPLLLFSKWLLFS